MLNTVTASTQAIQPVKKQIHQLNREDEFQWEKLNKKPKVTFEIQSPPSEASTMSLKDMSKSDIWNKFVTKK